MIYCFKYVGEFEWDEKMELIIRFDSVEAI